MMPGAVRMGQERSSLRLHLPSLYPVVTGMPELCRAGLSENWLLKACGHRHWMALAEAHGLGIPEFSDADGARLYPAFTFLRICNARLEIVGENRLIGFDIALVRASRTRFRSEIRVTCDGDPLAEVTMETVFVRRTIEGVNTSSCRAVVAGPCLLLPQKIGRLWVPDRGREDAPAIASIILDPSPNEDFNGVGFLYFSAFQAMADRAQWSWFRHSGLATTREREIAFLGNVDLGERITATLVAQARQGDEHSHTMTLSRLSDGVTIGFVTTRLAIDPALD